MLGRVLGAHGLDGRLKVASWTRPAAQLAGYNPWWLSCGQRWVRAWTCQVGTGPGGQLLARLAGLNDRDRARSWGGSRIAVPRARLPEPAQGVYYWCDLVGLAVYEQHSGAHLGRVSALLDNGAHELLEISGRKGRQLIPFVPGVHVHSVDLQAGRICVCSPRES